MSSALEDEERPTSRAGPRPTPGPDRSAGRLYRPLTLAVWGAVACFVVVGIGWPLVGLGTFGPTDVLARFAPYADSVLSGVRVQNPYLQDVADGVLPQTALFADLFRHGLGGAWNPYMLGGTPLGAVPNNAFFNPLSVPFYLLPAWFAPAWVKALEIAVSVGGTFLFARRLGLGRPAALVGGLVFATSGFMISWTTWTQSRTAAFVPVLFWAVERLVQRRRAGDVVLVSLAAAAMLLGGFPSVTGYALVAGGIYFLVRLVARYPGQWRRITAVAASGVGAVTAAAGLAAFQLLPFSYFISNAYVWGREQAPGDTIPFRALVTAIAPWALGTTYPEGVRQWAPGTHIVEALSYVGAAALLLALVGVAAARAGRALLPEGVWVFLVAATGVAMVLVYAGGPALALAQRLPFLFADNFVGRVRSVLGFLVAVLAAAGFEVLVWRIRATREKGVDLAGRLWGPAVWAGAALAGAGIVLAARRLAEGDPARLANFDRQVLAGLAFVAVAAGCVGVAWWVRRTGRAGRVARAAALVGIPVLIAVQALVFVRPYWARADRETFYPETDTHRFLAAHLGHERYTSPPNTLMPGESSYHRLRALTGHTFSDGPMGELIEALPGDQFKDPPTMPVMGVTPELVTSPILDRLAVRYYVCSTRAPVIGTPHGLASDGTSVRLTPGVPVTAPVQRSGPLRAVVVRVTEPTDVTTRLEVSVRGPDGTELAAGHRELRWARGTVTVHVPVAGEDVPDGTPLTATLTVRGGSLVLAADAGGPAFTTVGPADDGLRLVVASPAVVYERDRALPRIRWAGTAVVEPDAGARLAMLAGGAVAPDGVLLDSGAGGSAGSRADVDVVEDGAGAVEVAVDADGPGHLVVADALQHGWRATVDGEPAGLLAADHAVVAVAVGAGRHTVRLEYAAPYGGAGYWVSGASVVALGALAGFGWWRRRCVRPRSAAAPPPPTAAAPRVRPRRSGPPGPGRTPARWPARARPRSPR